jgi:serine protease Do
MANRRFEFTVVCGLMCLLVAGQVQPSQAQLLATQPVSSEARDRLFNELAEDVAALERQGNILKRVVSLTQPTVVHIDAKKAEDAFGRRAVEEAGSGVIIKFSNRYFVLTNRHVIKHAPIGGIEIKLSTGRHIRPTEVWADAGTDVAIMEIRGENLVPARLGDSSKVEIGDFVLAVGSPFGLSHSVTYGIISAKGRRDLQLGVEGVRLQDFFQTDAAINPGNSGGPLLNLRGEVVGINTAIASSSGGNEGIGFTIPINLAVYVGRQLVERGDVARAFLGVLLDAEYSEDEATQLGLPRLVGAKVKAITKNSAAEDAQLMAGDVILEYDGTRIEDDNHLINQVGLTPIGKEVKISLIRKGRPMELRTTVGTRPD